MILHFCPLCDAFAEPQPAAHDCDAQAIREWQEEIAATCAHEPRCGGPWQHATRTLLGIIHDREEIARLD